MFSQRCAHNKNGHTNTGTHLAHAQGRRQHTTTHTSARDSVTLCLSHITDCRVRSLQKSERARVCADESQSAVWLRKKALTHAAARCGRRSPRARQRQDARRAARCAPRCDVHMLVSYRVCVCDAVGGGGGGRVVFGCLSSLAVW